MNETNPNSNDVNLIIQDTYPISYNQIPSNFKPNTTISVKRDFSRFGERIYSKELVDTIVEEIRKLSDNVSLGFTCISSYWTVSP